MTKPKSTSTCPRCGKPVEGRFCASCGSPLEGATCNACARPLSAGARFCHHCGAPAGLDVRTPAPARNALAWLVPGIAVLALVAFLIGQRVGLGSPATDEGRGAQSAADGGAPVAASGASSGRVPDISQMSPEERANRLFDRVMRYGEEGKQDSARIFAPMAIQAYEMLGALDLHARYDVGMIALMSGDGARARAEADSILAKDRNHLLGLILAMKAAAFRSDATARAQYQKRLVAAEPAERARKLKEYDDHKTDIDAALQPLRGAKP